MPRKRTTRKGSVSSEPAPIAGPEAFRNHRDPSHVRSQAATLLLIGSHLRGDAPALQARVEASALLEGRVNAPAQDDAEALAFPTIRVTGERFPKSEMRALAANLVSTSGARSSPAAKPETLISRNAEAFYNNATPQTSAALLEASLRHPNPLVRVAAASSYVEVAVDPAPAIRVLEQGVGSRDLLVRDVAAYALAHIDPKNPKLNRLLVPRQLRSRRKRSRTSTIIHGTWAASSTWWQPPNGDFWSYLHDHVDSSLYAAQDRFGWTGGYSDAARADAGTALHDWVESHDLDGLDLYTHSHGGNVAMLANHAATQVGKLVLLSCPVHWPKYTPDFSAVQKVISVRVHLDLVILADRGGQKFTDPRIQENVLPVWFDHFATHDPANWQKYNIPAML